MLAKAREMKKVLHTQRKQDAMVESNDGGGANDAEFAPNGDLSDTDSDCVVVGCDYGEDTSLGELVWSDTALDTFKHFYIGNSRSNTYRKKAILRDAARGNNLFDSIINH